MKNVTIIASVVALLVGGVIGYSFGNGATNSTDTARQTKEIQDSITMMKEQSSTIQKMAEMMKTYGITMQSMGMKYSDQMTISNGKDMEMMGTKYSKDANINSGSTDSMQRMMGN